MSIWLGQSFVEFGVPCGWSLASIVCIGTPWESQHQDDAAVPIGEVFQETAADQLLQKPLEWQSFVWCFEYP